MILGFHYHIPAQERDGKIYTAGFLGVFLDGLAEKVETLICFLHTPLPAEMAIMDYTLTQKNIRFVSLGPHDSVPRRLLRARSTIRNVHEALKGVDVLLLRCPTPLLPTFAKVKNVNKAFLIVGDYEKSARDLDQPFFRKKAIQMWASFNKWRQNQAIKGAVVFVNNGLIYEELKEATPRLFLIRTTTLQNDDFFRRDDTCLNPVVNLLYAGRLDASKGLMEMIDALKVVREHGVDARLHFVGWEEKNATKVTEALRSHAALYGLDQVVAFHGKKTVGAELNSFYRMADIYMIASKVNEGFPRTIWEAFANSVPVIASTVGSIPLFLQNQIHAVLIPPGDHDAIASAILKVTRNPDLRKVLIRNGFAMAQETTVAIQAKKMVDIMKEQFNLRG